MWTLVFVALLLDPTPHSEVHQIAGFKSKKACDTAFTELTTNHERKISDHQSVWEPTVSIYTHSCIAMQE